MPQGGPGKRAPINGAARHEFHIRQSDPAGVDCVSRVDLPMQLEIAPILPVLHYGQVSSLIIYLMKLDAFDQMMCKGTAGTSVILYRALIWIRTCISLIIRARMNSHCGAQTAPRRWAIRGRLCDGMRNRDEMRDERLIVARKPKGLIDSPTRFQVLG